MEKIRKELIILFDRDLKRLINELKNTSKEVLWMSPEGVANSCGVLAQHLAGNLNYYIGTILGKRDYVRDRDKEFLDTGRTKEELIANIDEVRKIVSEVLSKLEDKQLEKPIPEEIPFDQTVRQFLIHLYGHLNYHLGQFNYLRRMVSEDKIKG